MGGGMGGWMSGWIDGRVGAVGGVCLCRSLIEEIQREIASGSFSAASTLATAMTW